MVEMAVSLVPFGVEHVERTFEWIKDKELRTMFLMRGIPTWEGHKEYCNRLLKDSTQHVFAIINNEHHVGNCGLKNLTVSEGELWIYIGNPLLHGKGIGKRSVELLLKEGFGEMGLQYIYIYVADFNKIALKMYRSIGFREIPLQDSSSEWSNRGCRIIKMELRN